MYFSIRLSHFQFEKSVSIYIKRIDTLILTDFRSYFRFCFFKSKIKGIRVENILWKFNSDWTISFRVIYIYIRFIYKNSQTAVAVKCVSLLGLLWGCFCILHYAHRVPQEQREGGVLGAWGSHMPASPENLCFQEESITNLLLILNVGRRILSQIKA